MPRDTRTGGVLESMILPALARGGYSYKSGINIGTRLGNGRHIIDVLAQHGAFNYLISLKWQQSSGTAEQKTPFEILCLVDAVQSNPELYRKAYLVLGGTGWTLRDFYISGGLRKYMNYDSYVNILNLESFVALANKGHL